MRTLLPDDPEIVGLLALMLLTDARRVARIGPHGEAIPLNKQDRSLWDRGQIDEGVRLISAVLSQGPLGPYQVQAAIAAIHDEAVRSEDTDWPQILALYDILQKMSDNPMVQLNHAVAAAMVHGPVTGLDLLVNLRSDERLKVIIGSTRFAATSKKCRGILKVPSPAISVPHLEPRVSPNAIFYCNKQLG